MKLFYKNKLCIIFLSTLATASLSATTSYWVTLKSGNGFLFWAPGGGGGGGTLFTNNTSPATYNTFILDDLNGGTLDSGDSVAIRAWGTGQYLSADNGGGGSVHISRVYANSWETFTIAKTFGSGTITTGSSISLRTSGNYYFCADNNGGNGYSVIADRLFVGTWETFTISVATATAPFWNTPYYSPTYWNNNFTRVNNNCYNYGTNKLTNTYAQVGRASGYYPPPDTIAGFTAGVIADGFEPTSKYATSAEGKTKMAMWVAPDPNNPGYCLDYHFIRQDVTGMWSHKQGANYSRNFDDTSALIYDPEVMTLYDYSVFAGWFWVPSSSAQTQGWANIF